jgi:hypothetical protein
LAETTVVTVKETRRRKQDRIKVIGIVEWITSLDGKGRKAAVGRPG